MYKISKVLAYMSALLFASMSNARIQDQISEYFLDNGMQVVVIEDHRAPVVVHMVWYRAGSADEPAGVSGVAHFLEHLLFKQTKNMEAGEFSRVVAENGGRDNAFTSTDYTAYYQRIASDRLEMLMRMEADRMVNLDLGPNDIQTERDVIIEERNQRTDSNANALFREQLAAAFYQNHRYGVPIIGWRHEMEKLDLDAALEFYRKFYAPNNAILVVAGDVDAQEVLDLAQKYYGAIPQNPNLVLRERPQEPPHIAERRINFVDPRIAQPYLARLYLAPERDVDDQQKAAALVLLAEILGGAQTSILPKALQFDDQIAVYSSASYYGTNVDDTSFSMVVVPTQGVDLSTAEQALDDTLQNFLKTGVNSEQLARIKMQLRASEIYARDNVEGLANSVGAALSSGLTLQDIYDWPDVLENISEEDILAVARDVLHIEKSITGWAVPTREDLK